MPDGKNNIAEQGGPFFAKIAATAIANQAVLKCSLAGVALNADNVTLFVGDFFEPDDPRMSGFAEMINEAIDEVVECQKMQTVVDRLRQPQKAAAK